MLSLMTQVYYSWALRCPWGTLSLLLFTLHQMLHYFASGIVHPDGVAYEHACLREPSDLSETEVLRELWDIDTVAVTMLVHSPFTSTLRTC